MPISSLTIPAFPKTPDDFRRWRDEIATTPQGGAAAFAVALAVYSEDPARGLPLLTLAIAQDELIDGSDGFGGKKPRAWRELAERNGRQPWIARSVFAGTSPANAYALPDFPLEIQFKEQEGDVKETTARVFVFTTGAGLPKPMRLARNDKGIWKATEWSSFQGNCMPPAKKIVDDL